MRGMLFLLLGFAAAVAVGLWFGQESASAPGTIYVSRMGEAEAPYFDWPLFVALAALAWGTAFIIRPGWLCIVHSLLFAGLGSLFIVGGALGALLDAGFNPNTKSYGPAIVGFGAVILASRFLTLALWRRALSAKRTT